MEWYLYRMGDVWVSCASASLGGPCQLLLIPYLLDLCVEVCIMTFLVFVEPELAHTLPGCP